MATRSASNANDLMVGAGTWYWYPWDSNGEPHRDDLHHFGDASSATISKDITTIEHNSSMDKARELMASVKTSETHTLTLTMHEYNPENLAMMLNGGESTYTQTAQTVTNEPHTVSPDTNIRLMDASGNPYHNVTNVTVSLANVAPATSFSSTTVNNSVTGGGTGIITLNGTYSGAASGSPNILVTNVNTFNNEIDVQYTNGATVTTATLNAANLFTFTADGITIEFTTASTSITDYQNNDLFTYNVTAATPTLVLDKDYIVKEVDIRYGIINIPANSSIPANTAVLVSYTVPAGDFPVVNGGITDRTVGLLFIGDPNVGPCYNGEIWKAKINPTGEVNLIGDDFNATDLEFKILSDRLHHPSQPLYTLTKVETNEA